MSANHRKRKHRSATHRDSQYSYKVHDTSAPQKDSFLAHHEAYLNTERDSHRAGGGEEPNPLSALYIQAYEADIVHGPDASSAARSLEVVDYQTAVSEDGTERVIGTTAKIGSALIKWGGDVSALKTRNATNLLDDDDDSLPPALTGASEDRREIWVDRYDARLLLDTLPPANPSIIHAPSSPTGWSDLPSDTEDTFFFTSDETEEFRKEKRRRLLDKTREERLKARMEEDGVEEEPKEEEDVWGGSDEEPDDTQAELMKRTAIHLLSSPNPAQLEMRILANHGADRRFQFLRGRWSRAWRLAKTKAKMEKDREAEDKNKQVGLGTLAGYGSGDSESEEEPPKQDAPAADNTQVSHTVDKPDETAEIKLRARRKRLEEWSAKRRAEKAARVDQTDG
ncbi:hypothetical protein CPC08DRAFT_707962 [Agrocybe pediades]|nr:hypothetical protein CPC08DRAFT_707962 [Agrocybe pediades]